MLSSSTRRPVKLGQRRRGGPRACGFFMCHWPFNLRKWDGGGKWGQRAAIWVLLSLVRAPFDLFGKGCRCQILKFGGLAPRPVSLRDSLCRWDGRPSGPEVASSSVRSPVRLPLAAPRPLNHCIASFIFHDTDRLQCHENSNYFSLLVEKSLWHHSAGVCGHTDIHQWARTVPNWHLEWADESVIVIINCSAFCKVAV